MHVFVFNPARNQKPWKCLLRQRCLDSVRSRGRSGPPGTSREEGLSVPKNNLTHASIE